MKWDWELHRIWFTAAAAKSLQSYPTLCDPIDGSLPGSPAPGSLQARTLEWVAISLSNVWKWKVKVKSLSHVRLLATPWTAAQQAPPSGIFQARVLEWGTIAFPVDSHIYPKRAHSWSPTSALARTCAYTQAPWLPVYLLPFHSFCQAGTHKECTHTIIQNCLLSVCVCDFLKMCTFSHMQISLWVWGAKSLRPHPGQAPARSFPAQPMARLASSDSTRDQQLPAPLGSRLGLL